MTYTGTDYELDYLFIAETLNGNIIKQDPTDKPKFSSWGSAFTDVVKEHLKRFSLVGKGHIFTIDLQDGHFEVDGRKLYSPKEILPGAQLKLIYYRTISRNMRMGVDGKPLLPTVKYVIGWQYSLNGKNYKWEMGVN
jgi:hypothetical protein